jgi:hypothetical protein
MSTARVWVANIPIGSHVLSFSTFKGRQICFEVLQTDSPTTSPSDPPSEIEEGGEGGGGEERRVLRAATTTAKTAAASAVAVVEGLVQLEENPKARST